MTGLMDMPPEIIELIYAHLAAIETAPPGARSFDRTQHRTCAPLCKALLPFTQQYKVRHLRFRTTSRLERLLAGLKTEVGLGVRSIEFDLPGNESVLCTRGRPFVERFGYPEDYYRGAVRRPLDDWEFPSWLEHLLALVELAQNRALTILGDEIHRVLKVKADYDEQVAIMLECKKGAIVEFKRRQQQTAAASAESQP